MNDRLNEVFDGLMDTLRDFIRDKRITHDEYRQAVGFLHEVGGAGEVPLFSDVFLEVTVDDVENRGRPGTVTTIEGPYYVPNAPELESPCALPQRADEPGPILVLSGVVRSTEGRALPGAVVDVWQPDNRGLYSHANIPAEQAPFNLRGRVAVDRAGRFEIETRVPGCYEIPKTGPTGKLLAALGRHAWRPAHLHVKIECAGHRPLTTQLFLKGDRWIDSDVVVGAVKPSLVVEAKRHDDRYMIAYDFVLERAEARAA